MAAVSYRIKKTTGRANIQCRISMNGLRPEKSLRKSIDTRCWDWGENMPKKSKLPVDVNPAEIKKLYNELNLLRATLLNRLNEDGHNLSDQWLQDEIDVFFQRRPRSGQDESILYWIEQYWRNGSSRINQQTGRYGLDKSTIGKFKTLYLLFEKFQGKRNFNVGDFGQVLANQFLKYLINEQAYKLSYARKLVSMVQTTCRDVDGSIQLAPDFERIKLAIDKRQEDPVILTPEEIQQIIDADIKQDYLKNARKWLLLICDVGARVSDFLNFTEENIVEDKGRRIFKYRQTKGGKNYIIRVPVLALAEKAIQDGFPRKISAEKLRKYIKEVCRLAGVDAPTEGWVFDAETKRKKHGIWPKYMLISTHVGRKTFSSYYNGKIERAAIMRATGHKKESTFLMYLNQDGHDYSEWDKVLSES